MPDMSSTSSQQPSSRRLLTGWQCGRVGVGAQLVGHGQGNGTEKCGRAMCSSQMILRKHISSLATCSMLGVPLRTNVIDRAMSFGLV